MSSLLSVGLLLVNPKKHLLKEKAYERRAVPALVSVPFFLDTPE
jgi:hypothetical protein